MQGAIQWWQDLGVAGQAALIGIVTSGIMALLQYIPQVSVARADIKRALVAVGAGVAGYAAGGVGAALAAALTAFGSYHVSGWAQVQEKVRR